MKNHLRFIPLFFLLLTVSSHATFVGVLETMADNKDDLTLSERQYLTNILREQAVRTLPVDSGYTIMTRENINMMLPPGKSIEDCEGSCLAETGKNIAADYVAQARVGRFGQSFSINVELYETATSKLVASFNGRGDDLVSLEQEIIQKSPELFIQARKVSNVEEPQETSLYNLSIVTKPEQAAVYVDGRPLEQCPNSPCQIQLTRGKHSISLEKDLYDALDTAIVLEENAEVFLPMSPNYGTLNVVPKMVEGVGSPNDLSLLVDGAKFPVETLNLKPGIHAIEIIHPCYTPVKFKIGVGKGSMETHEKEMKIATGALSLKAEKGGKPESVPVYVDGKLVGQTPYLGDVPLCSELTVGQVENPQKVDVALKTDDVVNYVHQLPVETKPAEPSKQPGMKKRFWGGATLGGSYNDYYDTKLGLGDIAGKYGGYSLSTQGEGDLLGNYWGLGGNLGVDLLFLVNDYFGLHLDVSADFRSGSGKSNFAVILDWNDSKAKSEKSDIDIKMDNYQFNIDVPLLFRVMIPGKAFVEVGPVASVNLVSESVVTMEDMYGSQTFKENNNLNQFEFDLAAGIGVTRFIGRSMLDLGLRAVMGMTRLGDEDDAPKTLQVQLNATYWFL